MLRELGVLIDAAAAKLEANPQTTRRAFLRGIVIGTAAMAACKLPDIPRAIDALHDEDIRGKFLDKQEGGPLVVVEKPAPVGVIFVPQKDKPLIPFRRQYSVEQEPELEISAPSIRARYATRVFGNGYISNTYLGHLGITNNGRFYVGGLWFALTDERGTAFIDPYGLQLKDGETPYGVAASFIEIAPKEEETQLTYDDLVRLKATHYLNMSVTIYKGEVRARRDTPTITSEYPTETNVVPWNNILKINGIDIQKVSRVTVTKPLVTTDGDNPTPDKSFSRWLIFLAEIKETKDYKETTKTVALYVNMSSETRQAVVADKPFSLISDADFTRVDKQIGNPLPKDLGVVGK